MEDLQTRLRELESRLTDTYRDKSETVTSILNLKEEKEKLLNSNDSAQRQIDALTTRINECEQDIKEKDLLIQNLKAVNEHLAGSNEELKSKVDNLIKDNEKIQHENNQLLERMLKLKEEQISQMNQLNEYYEALLKKEQAIEKLKSSGISNFNSAGLEANAKPIRIPSRPVHTIFAHNIECTSVKYNDGGSFVVTGGSDVYLKVWDANNGQEKSTLRGMAHSAMDVSICQGSELILAGCSDNIAYVWNYNTGRIKHNLTGHGNKICSTSFFNNKSNAVTASQDRTIKIWDVVKGYCTKTLPCISSCFGISLTTEDSVLASCHHDGHLRLWSPKSGQIVQDLEISKAPFTSCAFSPNGNFVALSGKDDHIHIVEVSTSRTISSLEHKNYVHSGNFSKIAWSSDSSYVCAGGHRGQLFIWSVNSSKIEEILDRGHSNPVSAVAWSPRENQIASVDTAGGLVLWT